MVELTFKKAKIEDYDDFYVIKCDPENVKWSGFSSAPNYERMKEWFIRQVDSELRTIFLCYLKGEICGFFYLDKCIDNNAEEIGYGVLTKFAGRGIGTAIVQYATIMCQSNILCAWVSDSNRASERCFEKNGFKKQTKIEQRVLCAFSEPHDFYFWSKSIR